MDFPESSPRHKFIMLKFVDTPKDPSMGGVDVFREGGIQDGFIVGLVGRLGARGLWAKGRQCPHSSEA